MNNSIIAPPDHPAVKHGKIGILLTNLGTPDATSYWPMRRYLKEFLSDKRVVETNRLVWWFILNGIILSRRPQKSGAAYEQIWNKEFNESPLKSITRSQSGKLSVQLASKSDIIVEWAMRYGNPTISSKIQYLMQQGCERILIMPLYPQYSAATTASVMDKVFDALQNQRWQPAIRTVPPYYDHPNYISALSKSIKAHIKTLEWKPDMILASFHGLPAKFIDKGDPYQRHCEETVQLLRRELEYTDDQLKLTYQSRTNRQVWISPYTEDEIAALPKSGKKNLLIITPGFAADCLETLEEIAIRAGEQFMENGGKNFSALPCLNDSELSISMIETLVNEQLLGWN